MKAVGELFQQAAKKPFHNAVKAAPLRKVESMWNSSEPGIRLVFQP
jgi:hypothetical protein